MTPELQAKFDELSARIDVLSQALEMSKTLQPGQIIQNEVRIAMGVGFIGRTTDTTPAGAILVNSPEGIIKILTA